MIVVFVLLAFIPTFIAILLMLIGCLPGATVSYGNVKRGMTLGERFLAVFFSGLVFAGIIGLHSLLFT